MIAGLDVMRIINEPTAAAIAYGLDQKERGSVKERLVRDHHYAAPCIPGLDSSQCCVCLALAPHHVLATASHGSAQQRLCTREGAATCPVHASAQVLGMFLGAGSGPFSARRRRQGMVRGKAPVLWRCWPWKASWEPDERHPCAGADLRPGRGDL